MESKFKVKNLVCEKPLTKWCKHIWEEAKATEDDREELFLIGDLMGFLLRKGNGPGEKEGGDNDGDFLEDPMAGTMTRKEMQRSLR